MRDVRCPDCGSTHELTDELADAAEIAPGDAVVCPECADRDVSFLRREENHSGILLMGTDIATAKRLVLGAVGVGVGLLVLRYYRRND